MAPNELAQIRELLASLERTLLGRLAEVSSELAGYAAHQSEHAARLREHTAELAEIKRGCAESRARRAGLEATGAHQSVELDRLRGRATHWGSWAFVALWGILVAVLAAVASRHF